MAQTTFEGWFMPTETGKAHFFEAVPEGHPDRARGEFRSLCGRWVVPAWHTETCRRITQSHTLRHLCSRCYPLEADRRQQLKKATQ